MSYSDNPRIVKGKVEVVFADTDISSVDEVIVSTESVISHPNEIYGTNLNPTVKACTMDGTSIMDGSFQMLDDTCVVGWWGRERARSDGYLKECEVLTIKFQERPIGSWTIIGDSKRGEYPVEMRIDFIRDNTIIESVSINQNDSVVKKIYPNLVDIDRVDLYIMKWSQGDTCVKMMKFFDLLSETYEGSDLLSFEVNEEMSPEDSSYSINSDTMCVSIYNKDSKFTTGYLKKLLVLDRKIKPFIGIVENGEVVYTPLGTFYSDEWKIDDEGMWLKCTAVDKLMRLQNKTYVGLNIEYDMSLYDIAEDVLTKAGFNSNQYEISNSLRNIIIPNAFMPKDTIWNALQEIANAGLCKIYVDRNDKIVIRDELDIPLDSGITLSPSNTFSHKSNISLTEFANKVSVEYCDVEILDDVVSVAETTVTLNAEEEIVITLDYSHNAAYPQVESSNVNFLLSDIELGVNACTLKIKNTLGNRDSTTITVTGNSIDVTYKTIAASDDASVRDYGEFEYSHPSSELIQTYDLASRIASTILNKLKAGEGVITNKWRGSTDLTLGKHYKVIERNGNETDLVCEYNKITYDGGLTQETRGRKQ